MRTRVSKTKSTLSAMCLTLTCVVGAVTMLVAKGLRSRVADTFPLQFHGFVCRLFSLSCEFEGTPSTEGPTMFVSNHVSYLDVFVLGSRLQGSFVAKSEVASWPAFGKLAKLQNTLFLERDPRRAIEQVEVLSDHLSSGGNLIVFPEGTSTAGTDVARFRSSLFAAAEEATVQPVSIAYVDYEGEPMTQEERDHYAWYLPDPGSSAEPNRAFLPHFFTGLGLGRCTVKVCFHEPVRIVPGERKRCAEHCENEVRTGLHQLLGTRAHDVATAEFSSAT